MAKKDGVIIQKGPLLAQVDTEGGQRYTVALAPLGISVDARPGETVELEIQDGRVTVVRRKD